VETALDPGFSGRGITYGPRADAIGSGKQTRDNEKDRNAPADDEEEGSGTFFYPALGVGVSTDDNINRTPGNKQSATIFHLRPALGLQTGKGATRFNAGYEGNYARYSGTQLDSDLYDYTNHKLFASVAGFGRKTGYNVTVDYTLGTNTISGENIDDNLRRFDKWSQISLLGSTDLGARGARINLRLDGLVQQKRQDTLKSIDYDTAALAALLKVRVGSKSYGVLEGGLRRYDYINSNQDADRLYVRVGVSWEATAKTKGLLTYGVENYKPENPGASLDSTEFGPAFGNIEEEKTSSTWHGKIDWEIRTRDLIRFGTYRGSRISNGTGSSTLSTRYTIGWTHDWSERVRSNLGYLAGTEEYKGADRTDDLISYNLDVSYKFRRNLLIRGYYVYEDKESDLDRFSYDKNRLGLFLEWEL